MIESLLLAPHGVGIYFIIAFLLLGGAFFLPFPEDLVLILTGVLIERDLVRLDATLFVVYTAIVAGDLFLYFLGYRFGMTLFKKRWFRSRIHPSKIKKARLHLEDNNLMTVFVARHLFYLRSITFITCGAVKMKFSRFLLADSLAALISTPIMLGIGYLASENYVALKQEVHVLKIGIPVVLVVVAISYYLKRRIVKPQPITEDELAIENLAVLTNGQQTKKD